MPLVHLPKGSLLKLNTVDLSEHNRSALAVEIEEIMGEARTVTGTLRRYVFAKKHHFTVSWEFLPDTDAKTVDGKAGRDTLVNLRDTNSGPMTLKFRDASGEKTYTVFFESYSEELTKRWSSHYWTVSIGLVEQ